MDKFLGQRAEEQKKEKKQASSALLKKKLFRRGFAQVLQEVIHPAMMAINEKLRNRQMNGKMLRNGKTSEHLHENYGIYPYAANGVHFTISVVGDANLQKVVITITYLRAQADSTHKPVKTTEEQFDLADVSTGTFDKLVLAGIQEALAIK